MCGTVFDIQRGSFHDGPGLRTTVFLKGCPLRCTWCHNPESQKRHPELSFRADKCTGCQRCVDACKNECHTYEDGLHRVDRTDCQSCGACVESCPSEALSIFGKKMSAEEVMSEVLRDQSFYKKSGGGLTLSGGEPTVQLEFCLSLLQRAKEAGIHTCVETCGISARSHYEKLLSFVDLFLFDYKATGNELHRQLTGVGNEAILVNLKFLHDRGAKIIVRCPIIPGVNDAPEHFAGISRLSAALPHLEGIELLPYHEAGADKYERTGRPRPQTGACVPREGEAVGWLTRLRELGCTNAVLSA